MSDFDHHIYRIQHKTKDAIVLSKNPSGVDTYHELIIASFKTADLRDLAYDAFIIHIRMNRKLYPHHLVD